MLRPQRTIRTKLILSISIPLLVTYLGLLVWDYYRQRSITVLQMQQNVLHQAEATAARLDARLATVTHTAGSLATLFEGSSRRGELQVRAALVGAVRMPWVTSATIVLDPGPGATLSTITRHRAAGPPSQNRDRVVAESAAPAWYAKVKASYVAGWSDAYAIATPDNAGQMQVCTYAAPIVVESQVTGAAAITIDLRQMRRFRAGRDFGPPIGPGGPPFSTTQSTLPAPPPPPPDVPTIAAEELEDFAVFDSNGRLLTAPSTDAANPPTSSLFDTAQRLGQPEMADAARLALKGDSQVIRVTGLKQVVPSVPDDTHHWLAMTPVPATGWLLVTAVPESANLAPVLRRLVERAAFLAGGLVILLGVVLFVSVGISKPIERLAAAVDRVAAGDLTSEIQNGNSNDELGRLTLGFNHMTRQLQSQMAALTEQTAAREKVESELRIARQIQNDLLPSTYPDSPQFALHAFNLPAMHVAGDFYDFFFTPGGLLTLVIADVSGKGVPAALLMAVTRTVVRNLAQAGHSPAEIAAATNRSLLTDTSASMFVTMLLCQYDPSTGKLTYVNAGHPPAIRLRKGCKPAEVCNVQSPLLGVDSDGSLGTFEQDEMTLDPGDTLFLYTDGVSEACDSDGVLLRTSGICTMLTPFSGDTPESVCRQTAECIETLCGGQRSDDITMLALRRTEIVTSSGQQRA